MKKSELNNRWILNQYDLKEKNPKYWKMELRDEDQVWDSENEEVCYQVYVGGIW